MRYHYVAVFKVLGFGKLLIASLAAKERILAKKLESDFIKRCAVIFQVRSYGMLC